MCEHAIDRDAQSEPGELVDRAVASDDLDSVGSEKRWIGLAEESFAFWDNEEDSIYDAL